MAEQGAATPQTLGRMATRAEIRQPGTLGGMIAGSLLSSVAAAVIGSMIAPAEGNGLGDADQALGGGDIDMGSFDV